MDENSLPTSDAYEIDDASGFAIDGSAPPKSRPFAPYKPLAEAKHLKHIRIHLIYPFFYLRSYADLTRHFGPDRYYAAVNHWYNYGIKEGRCPSPFFDPKYYLSIHPDLRRAFNKDYKKATNHFVKHGINEGRRGSRVFHLKFYFDSNPDVQRHYPSYLAAFQHWLHYGHKEGRKTTADGPRLEFYQGDMSFGSVRDQPNFFRGVANNLGDHRSDEERVICGMGYALCILHTMTAPPEDKRCQRIVEACGGGSPEDRQFSDDDRNQYETEQMLRNAYTA